MKKYLFLIILTIIALNGFAQDKTNANSGKETNIFRQPDLEKFYGTWLYEKDGKYFSIYLEKYTFNDSPTSGMDFLGGTHVFKQNDKIVDEKRDADVLSSIKNGTFERPSKNLISFRFHEYRRSVFGTGTMEYIDGATPTIVWKLNLPESRRRIIFPGEEHKKDLEYIVPTSIILHKVK